MEGILHNLNVGGERIKLQLNMINKHNLNLPWDKSCHAINDKQLHFMLEKWNLDLLQAGKKNKKTYKLEN